MSAFLLKAEHGPAYIPPACTPGVFADVACPSLFADWIEQLFAEGITGGCSAGPPALYCPDNPVTRAQMSVFLLKTEHGSGYIPPACTPGLFNDVPCPSLFADWIEQLFNEGITGGCGGGNYCPDNSSTRGQMAVFLDKIMGLPGPPPPTVTPTPPPVTPTLTPTSRSRRRITPMLTRTLTPLDHARRLHVHPDRDPLTPTKTFTPTPTFTASSRRRRPTPSRRPSRRDREPRTRRPTNTPTFTPTPNTNHIVLVGCRAFRNGVPGLRSAGPPSARSAGPDHRVAVADERALDDVGHLHVGLLHAGRPLGLPGQERSASSYTRQFNTVGTFRLLLPDPRRQPG